MVLYRFAASSAVRACPLVVLAATASAGSSPVTSQSTVTAHFSVENMGAARGVSFTPHTDAEMEKCMAGTMEKWKFPAFQGDPVAFEQPVNLVAK